MQLSLWILINIYLFFIPVTYDSGETESGQMNMSGVGYIDYQNRSVSTF